MYLLVLIIFGKYCIRHILCGHSKIIIIFQQYYCIYFCNFIYILFIFLKYFCNFTIFPRNVSTVLSKYFGAVRVMMRYNCEKKSWIKLSDRIMLKKKIQTKKYSEKYFNKT